MTGATRRLYALGLVAVVVTLGVVHVAWLEPRDRERRSLEGQVRRLSADIADLQAGATEMDRWMREERGWPKRAAPAGTMVATLLDALARIGERHRVRTLRIQPVGPEVDEVVTDQSGVASTYRRAEIRFRMEARYRNLGEYLAEVEALDQLVVVRSVALRPEAAIAPRLVADVTLWVFGKP